MASPLPDRNVIAVMTMLSTFVVTANVSLADPSKQPSLTTQQWTEPSSSSLLHDLLTLPESLIQVAFTPLQIILSNIEEYRIDRRLADAFRFSGHFAVSPQLKLSTGAGIGFGAALSAQGFLDQRLRSKVAALYRINNDYEWSIVSRYESPTAEGRAFELEIEFELDQNQAYYGLGADTQSVDRRALERVFLDSSLTFDLTPKGAYGLTASLTAGHLYEGLRGGNDPVPGRPPVGQPGDTVEPPVGFGDNNHYLFGTFALVFDSRDLIGRPARGVFAKAQARAATEAAGQALSGIEASLEVRGFHEVLPRRRVLTWEVGGKSVAPLQADHLVPFHQLAVLGGRNNLRGFNFDRFRGELAYWANVEYRFPIYEYFDTGIVLDALTFFEVGRVGNSTAEIIDAAPHYAYGFGLRAAAETTKLFDASFGFSQEGFEFRFGLVKEL